MKTDPDARAFAIGYVALLGFFLAPLGITPYLPGLDMPFHLSLADMLNKAGQPGSPYDPYYQGTLGVAPYAAHYLALRLLSHVMSLTAAHAVVVGIYIAGLPLAVSSLLGACGRSRIPALLAFPLAYNLTLHYGFVSFALSIPVLVWMLAAFAKFLLREPGTPETARALMRAWLGPTLLAGLLFLCHLQNFLFGVCAAGAFVLFSGVAWRRRLQASVALLPAFSVLAWWQVRARYEGDPLEQKKSLSYVWETVKMARLNDMEGGRRPLADDLLDRMYLLPRHLLRGFADLIDVRAAEVLLCILAAYVLVGLGAAIWAVAKKEEARPRAKLRFAGWLVFAGALAAYFGLPHHLSVFELMTFFPRFAVLAVIMALLLIPAGLKSYSGAARWLIVFPALLSGALYGRQLIIHYRMYGEEIADFETVLRATAPGGKALGMVFDRRSRVMRIESALLGLPSLYPAVKPAPGSMVPLSYCGMRHIPCRMKPPAQPLPPGPAMPDAVPWQPDRIRTAEAVAFFDYFFVRSPPPGRQIFGAWSNKVEVAAQSGTWTVYRRKTSALAPPAKP